MKKAFLILSSLALLVSQSILYADDQTSALNVAIKRRNNLLVKTRQELSNVLNQFPYSSRNQTIEKELGSVTFQIIHLNISTPETILYKVKLKDTLEKIAQAYQTTPELIKIRNTLKNSILKKGQELSLWNKPFVLYVNRSTNRLFLKLNNRTIKEYAVSTGKSSTETPLGEFTIFWRGHTSNTWFKNAESLLGSRWIGFLDTKNAKIGIHGTNEPQLIGQSVSHGCVRMTNKDVEELYDLIPLGTKIIIVDNNPWTRLRLHVIKEGASIYNFIRHIKSPA